MEKISLPGFGLGLWSHEFSDVKNPSGSLQTATDVYVGAGGELRMRGPVSIPVSPGNSPYFAFAGALIPGHRTIFGGGIGEALFVLNPVGPAAVQLLADCGRVTSVALVGDLMVFAVEQPSGDRFIWAYGGSLKPQYITTLGYTQGSTAVTGTGFTANVDAGMVITFPVTQEPYVVRSVDSNTSLTLNKPWTGATGSSSTNINPVGLLFGGSLWGTTQWYVGAIAGRLLVMQGSDLSFSDGPDPATAAPRLMSFPTKNFHGFPNTSGSGMAALRDLTFVFTDSGIYTIRGMAYEIVDGSANPQHQVELMSGEMIPLGQGIAQWQGALLIPCRDAIYVVDGISAPVNISRGLPWAEWVRAGIELGWATVFNGYYLLPISVAGADWTTLCVRLDGVDSGSGMVFPTTRLDIPGQPQAWANQSPVSLLVAANNKLLEAVTIFSSDTDGVEGSAHVSDGMVIGTQLVALGDKGVVRRVRLRYSMTQAGDTEFCELSVKVKSDDADTTETVSIGGFGTPPAGGTRWVAFDLENPVEAATVRIEVRLGDLVVFPPGPGTVGKFVLHQIEIQYRAFGGGS